MHEAICLYEIIASKDLIRYVEINKLNVLMLKNTFIKTV